MDWTGAAEHAGLLEFTRGLAELRRAHPVFRRRRFFTGPADIGWLTPAGTPMTGPDWSADFAKSLAVFLPGDAIGEPGPRGEPVKDDSFLLMFNAAEHDVEFTVPAAGDSAHWVQELDTADPAALPAGAVTTVKPGDALTVASRSMRLLRRVVTPL